MAVVICRAGVKAYTLFSKGHMHFEGETIMKSCQTQYLQTLRFSGTEFPDVFKEAKGFLSKI